MNRRGRSQDILQAHRDNLEALCNCSEIEPKDLADAPYRFREDADRSPGLADELFRNEGASHGARLRHVENTLFDVLFRLSPGYAQRWRLVLPSRYYSGPFGTQAPLPPRPRRLALRDDGADNARVLLSVAKYAIALLETFSRDDLIRIARQTVDWPLTSTGSASNLAAIRTFAKDIELGRNSPVSLEGKDPDGEANRIVLGELRNIHFYLVATEDYNRDLDWGVVEDPEEGLLKVDQPTAWQKQADRLPPLCRATKQAWWRVLWAKLNEERFGSLHLPPVLHRATDLSEIGTQGARDYERDRLVARRIMGADAAHQLTRRLTARNGVWCGSSAEELGVAGMPMNGRSAKSRIRRSLQQAFKLLVR